MSTVIQDAYILPAHINAGNVMAWAFSHREHVVGILDEAWERAACRAACEKLDRLVLVAAGLANEREEDKGDGQGLLQSARWKLELDYNERNKKGWRMPDLDTQVKLHVFLHEGRCIAKLVCDSDKIREYFHGIDGIEDFSYWNSSDGPDGMSEQEWGARGKLWNSLVPSGRYDLHSMVLNISLEGDVPYRAIQPGSIAGHLPDLGRRAVWATHATAVSAQIFEREGQAMSSIMKMDKGQYPEFNAMRDTIQAMLPETDEAARMLCLSGHELGAAIEKVAMRFNTAAAGPGRPGPRI